MRIEQALHGYDEGHRQLATSAKLTLEEERTLDLLSDLSGYLPPGTRFDSYETGYPCGRFYVYARTWPDWTGQRSGTVLTHSLLIPRDACNEIEFLAALESLFQFPMQPIDRKTYRRSIDWNPTPVAEALLSPRARGILAASWFGQDIRPILWTDADTGTNAQLLLWLWLPPWQRANHAFCTFAIQPRYLGPKLFDFLVLAKGGDSAFYSLRDRIVRCDGQQATPTMARLLESDWVNEIANNPAEKVQAIWREAREWGIPMPKPAEIKLLFLYREFRMRSESHFTAALTRIDLLQKLAPNLDQATEEKEAALYKCVELARLQLPEKYLTVTLDILERDPSHLAPALFADVASFVRQAFEHGTETSTGQMIRVWSMAQERGFAEPAREGLLAAFHAAFVNHDATSSVSRYSPILDSLVRADADIVPRILNDLPSERRQEFVHQLLDVLDHPFATRVARVVLDLAERLRDVSFLDEIASLVEPQALLRTINRLVAWDRSLGSEQLASVLSRIDIGIIMDWLAKECAESFIAEPLAYEIAKLLPDSDAAKTLLWSALPSAGGIAVLIAFAATRRQGTVEAILDDASATIPKILELAEQFPERSGFDKLVPIVVNKCDDETLLRHFDQQQPAKWQSAPWAGKIAKRLLMTQIRKYLDGSSPVESLEAWLSSPAAAQWLQREHRLELMYEFERARGARIGRAMELLQTANFAFLRDEAAFVTRCLEIWGHQPIGVIVSVVPQWLALLKSLPNQKAFVGACTVSLRIALNAGTRELAPLAEVSFVPVHDGLFAHAAYNWWILDFIQELLGNDWDRAKQVRKGFVRAWLHYDWPPLSLLRAAQGQANLFQQLAERVMKENDGKRAMRRLVEEARRTPDADPRWGPMLDRLPSSVRDA